MQSVGIIPARYESSRFPGKPLVELAGLPMIIHVIQNASRAELLNDVIVATDDERIVKVVKKHGYKAVMTRDDHTSGSDRIWEVAAPLDVDVVINIQGDEPAISGEILDQCLQPLQDEPEVDVVTLCRPVTAAQAINPNLVKVVISEQGRALYFSRSPIPHHRQDEFSSSEETAYMGHVGIYAYSKTALQRFCSLAPSQLEKRESLEQLRGLEAGMFYKVIQTSYESVDVNVPEDVERAEAALRRLQEGKKDV